MGLSTVRTFYVSDYIPAAQMAFVRNHDIASQDEAVVTAGLQNMHDAGVAWVEVGTDRIAQFEYGGGKFAVNDEIFSEDFAQSLWDLVQAQNKFVFNGGHAIVKTKNWPSATKARSSGLWALRGITAPVPAAMFRWEQRTYLETGPIIRDLILEGSKTLTDPIGFKGMRLNKFYTDNFTVRQFFNCGRMIESAVNADEYAPIISQCGWQPTNFGGASGFMPTTTRFSCVNNGDGTSTVTATEPIFTSAHVSSKQFYVSGAGAGGNAFSGSVNSFVSATQIKLNGQCAIDVTGAFGSFDTIIGTITAGTNIVTLSTATLPSLVGRYVMIFKGRSTIMTGLDVFVTRVVAQSGNQLTLATNSSVTTTAAPIIVAPADAYVYSDDYDTTDTGRSNDYQIWGMRNENEFYSGEGAAVCAIWQRAHDVQLYGGKTHGTNSLHNNFGGNFTNTIFDDCWHIATPNHQYEWGCWNHSQGVIIVCGTRNYVLLNDINIGTEFGLDRTGLFVISPRQTGTGLCRVVLSGQNFSGSGWPNANQAFVRNGPNGHPEQFISGGMFKTRDQAGWPEMRPTEVQSLRIASFKTPASAGAVGALGDIAWDGNYLYVCVNTNSWKRAALAAW